MRPRCEECPLARPAGELQRDLAALSGCGSCSLEEREDTAPLVQRLRQADVALRRARADLRRAELEARELADALRTDEERIGKLEALQKAGALQLEAAIGERDALLRRQSEELRERSAPILEVGERVLALPLIGAFDEQRAGEVLSSLLAEVARRQATLVAIDLTGVDEVDVAMAQRIVDLCRAVRLLGTSVCLCGFSPALAQALVDRGAGLGGVRIVRSLKDALHAVG